MHARRTHARTHATVAGLVGADIAGFAEQRALCVEMKSLVEAKFALLES